jgi:hypothetical protein
MSLGTLALGVLCIVLAVVGTAVGYYLVSGDWLWKRGDDEDRRNWPPPR